MDQNAKISSIELISKNCLLCGLPEKTGKKYCQTRQRKRKKFFITSLLVGFLINLAVTGLIYNFHELFSRIHLPVYELKIPLAHLFAGFFFYGSLICLYGCYTSIAKKRQEDIIKIFILQGNGKYSRKWNGFNEKFPHH